MSEPASPVPEPTEEDERLALDALRLADATSLQGQPDGDERCGDCHFLLDRSQDISYCWNDDLEILVAREWWCDRWQPVGAADTEPGERDQARAAQLRQEKVVEEQWVTTPRSGERCNDCLFFLNPDESVSYCWHPELRVIVGADHWCQHWEAAPATQADAY